MVKQGPCFHCGIARTPLWRNGPPEKPVLCNACGSRYRIRGTLHNYSPKHLQETPLSSNGCNNKRARATGLNTTLPEVQEPHLTTGNNFTNSFCADSAATGGSYHEGDGSNKSGSSMSISTTSLSSYPDDDNKSCGPQLPPGKIHRSLWDFHIPKRKRTMVMYRRLSPMEQLHRDLYYILRHEDPSILQESQEDVLLYHTNNQIAPPEIGLGCILLKTPMTPIKHEPEMQSAILDKKHSSLNDTQIGSSPM